MNRAVFLDRDGVINKARLVNGVPAPPETIFDVEILEGVNEAIQSLLNNQIIPLVITNQPDVSRGKTSERQVNEINGYIAKITGLNHFYTCFHDDAANCFCRKPSPGLIYTASIQHQIDLSRSWMVGDRWRDIEAGQRAGCRTFFIDYKYSEKQPNYPFTRVTSLLQAVNLITGGSHDMEK